MWLGCYIRFLNNLFLWCFLWLKIVKNGYTWEWCFYFWLRLKKLPESAAKQATSILGKTSRSSLSQMFFRIGVLKNFANFIGKHQCWSIFSIKLQTWTLLKIDSTRVFSCEIYNIFQNTFFYRAPPVAASEQTQEIYVVHCVVQVMLWSFSTILS